MNEQSSIEITNLNDIVFQKLQGIINKLDIVSNSADDITLLEQVKSILKNHELVAQQLKQIQVHHEG